MRERRNDFAVHFGTLIIRELVGFSCNDNDGQVQRNEPEQQLEIAFQRAMPAVDNRDGGAQGARLLKITFDQTAPILALGLRDFGIAITGQIDKIKRATEFAGLRETVEIELARFAGRAAGTRKILAPNQAIDEARFSHIRPAAKSDLRQIIFGKLRALRRADDEFRCGNSHGKSNGFKIGNIAQAIVCARTPKKTLAMIKRASQYNQRDGRSQIKSRAIE